MGKWQSTRRRCLYQLHASPLSHLTTASPSIPPPPPLPRSSSVKTNAVHSSSSEGPSSPRFPLEPVALMRASNSNKG